jgi:CRISPR-associated protein Csx16
VAARIVTFLGMGSDRLPNYYEDCRYVLDAVETPSATPLHDTVTVLACEPPVTLLVLGTAEVRDRWFGPEARYRHLLEAALPAGMLGPAIGFRQLPYGETETERWRIFETVVDALSTDPVVLEDPAVGKAVQEPGPPGTLILDITHGFRSQPFFAASALSFVGSELRRLAQEGARAPGLRILYAAFEARDRNTDRVPVWDLTQFSEVMAWDAAIDATIRFGRADDLEALLKQLQGRIVKAGGVQPPQLGRLGTALRDLTDALVTTRVPLLLTELSEHASRTVESARHDVLQRLPPLARQLEALREWLEPLGAQRPISPQGLRASLHLARVYRRTERYAELASLLRELVVSAYTLRELEEAQAIQPAQRMPGFDKQRKEMEDRLGRLLAGGDYGDPLVRLFGKVGDLRNDVMHSAFRKDPRRAGRIRRDLDRELDEMEAAFMEAGLFAEGGAPAPPVSPPSKTYFVTRHPGARAWAAEEGIPVDEVVDHLGVETIRPGDVVIGSLPVNLAAEVCRRGGRYLHLSVDLTPELRGVELSAGQMRACGARVEEYGVVWAGE